MRRLFERWVGAAPADLQKPPAAVTPPGPRLVLVDHGAEPQCAVRIGWLVPDRGSEDIPALRFLAGSLAHGALGRLGQLLRVDRSETYGVHAALEPRAGVSEFVVSTSIERVSTADALREALAEIERVRAEGAAGLDAPAARVLLRDLAWESFETSDDVVTLLTDPVLRRAPIDPLWQGLLAPTGFDPAQAAWVASKYLTSESRRIVVVGDASRVRSPLEALGLGEIAVR